MGPHETYAMKIKSIRAFYRATLALKLILIYFEIASLRVTLSYGWRCSEAI